MDNLQKVFQSIVGLFLEWFDCLRHPYSTCETILSQDISSSDKLSKSLRIWLTSFVLSIILQMPIYQLTGIDWKNLTFHLPNMLVFLVTLFAIGSVMHIGLKLRKIPSDLTDTLVIYTVIMACFAPLLILSVYPAQVKTFAYIQTVKRTNSSIQDAFVNFIADAALRPSYVDYVNAISLPLIFFLIMLSLSMIINLVSCHYKVEKYRVTSAIIMSAIFMVPISLALNVLTTFVIYVAVK
jgi:hypothetical protein